MLEFDKRLNLIKQAKYKYSLQKRGRAQPVPGDL